MKIENVGYTVSLSVKELSVIMAALRSGAKYYGAKGSNVFSDLHGEFVRQTGFSSGDHAELLAAIKE